MDKMPVAYIPHGGGPWPFVDLGLDRAEVDSLADYLKSLAALPPETPRALLVVSAHWEQPVASVMTSAAPPILYDYYGFPPASYEITWPAPGDRALAARVRGLLSEAGFETGDDPKRGFDHGTFIPLKLTYPEADVPTTQLSLVHGLDPATHLEIGHALQPLREEGVFIVGSGMSFHNMRAFGRAGDPQAAAFDAWLTETVQLPAAERDERLRAWSTAPGARFSHPREEHLLPLMVVAGAAGADAGEAAFHGTMFGMPITGVHFQ